MASLTRTTRKITFTLLAGQSLFSAAMIVAFTIASIIAVELGQSTGWTGVPSTLVVAGAALTAYPIGRFMDRVGRRQGLSVGYVLGMTATLTAGIAVFYESLFLFLGGIFLLGMTKGVLDQGRYAAADANPPDKRAQAISWVVLGGTAGSILGPTLIASSSAAAARLGLPELVGPWLAGFIIFSITLALISGLLRPDPQQIARMYETNDKTRSDTRNIQSRPYRLIISNPQVQLATTALIIGQLAMVVVMTMTPVHMHQHQHELGAISWVIMGHTMGMFGLSTVTGWLVERLGRMTIIMVGSLLLAVSCLMAPLNTSTAWLIISLFLLGLGWNFCFVAGSALLSDGLQATEHGRVQGLTDSMINVVSIVGSFGGGLIFAAYGYTVISWLSILISLVPLAMIILRRGVLRAAPLEQPLSG